MTRPMLAKFRATLLALTLFLPASAGLGAECTHLWQHDLSTATHTPKGMSGDTGAGYALFAFSSNNRVRLVLEGQFPHARFFSLQTYSTRLLRSHESLLDQNMLALPGSFNPVLESHWEAGQRWVTEIVPPGSRPVFGQNVLSLSGGFGVQSVMMRIYAPNQPLTLADLPRIFAFDARTGRPVDCPSAIRIPFQFDFPQIVGALAPRNATLKFGKSGQVSGQNSAIPGYMYVLTSMNRDDIAFVKFKRPQTRYWSLCVQNFLENQTRACIPDQQARPATDDHVYIALSENPALLAEAQNFGWNTLHFSRAERQRVFGFVYRNILPATPDFYEGPYAPHGVICSAAQFREGSCRLD
jgi:hypothetical protein